MPHKLLDISISRVCPVRLGASVRRYAEEYKYWVKGMMPNEGTHRDQPYKYVQAMNTLSNWLEVRAKNEQ